MENLYEILEFNKKFVADEEYEQYRTSRFPDKRMVILTCMDTRLVELLPQAMNLKNGDAKIIKNAGAIITSPYGNIMRSIIVAVYAMKAREICVIGHHDCGMTGFDSNVIIDEMKGNGISEDVIMTLQTTGVNLSRWLRGFDSVQEGVETSVKTIRRHPLLPRDIPVHGLIIDPATGLLEHIVNGYTRS